MIIEECENENQMELLKNIGGFRDIELSEKYNKIFEKAVEKLIDGSKDKDNDFDTTRKIWFLQSPLQQAHFKYETFFRITDAIMIVEEAIKFVEKELSLLKSRKRAGDKESKL